MPIYEYQCSACGELSEVLQKISDEPLSDCPKCGKAALRKKISAAAFRLKGSGWYETDFKSGNKKNLAGDQGTGADGAGKSGDKAKAGDSSAAAGSGGDKAGGAAKSEKSTGSSSA